jgi:hypothetical protein
LFLDQPEDWDDEEDGEWKAPTIPNPEYKGPWKAKVFSVCDSVLLNLAHNLAFDVGLYILTSHYNFWLLSIAEN